MCILELCTYTYYSSRNNLTLTWFIKSKHTLNLHNSFKESKRGPWAVFLRNRDKDDKEIEMIFRIIRRKTRGQKKPKIHQYQIVLKLCCNIMSESNWSVNKKKLVVYNVLNLKTIAWIRLHTECTSFSFYAHVYKSPLNKTCNKVK